MFKHNQNFRMPSTLKACVECTGRFTGSFFTDPSLVCTMCKIRRQLESKIVSLTRRVDALEEFAASNIGHSVEGSDTNRPRQDAAQVDSVVPPAVADVCQASGSPPLPPNATNSSCSAQDDGFQPVRNGARVKSRCILPVTTFNRFQAIAEPEEANEARIVGDSIVQGQLIEFCGRAPTKRKRFCIPGASVDDVAEAVDTVVEGVPANGIVIIHAGTNDIMRTRSEELLEKYRRMIRRYKEKTNNIMISGILPRIDAGTTFYGKAYSTNNRVKNLCSQEGIEFIDTWNDFYGKRELFTCDGLHLNTVGSARLGRLINNAVRFFSRRIQQRGPVR